MSNGNQTNLGSEFYVLAILYDGASMRVSRLATRSPLTLPWRWAPEARRQESLLRRRCWVTATRVKVKVKGILYLFFLYKCKFTLYFPFLQQEY